jgi:hypothetical protein
MISFTKKISVEALNRKWEQLASWFEKEFGMESDSQSMLFMIGIQELGKGAKKFSKSQKIDLIHIGICTVLKKGGFYTFSHRDDEGWPHFENAKKLPMLKGNQQEQFMKEALITYFEEVKA